MIKYSGQVASSVVPIRLQSAGTFSSILSEERAKGIILHLKLSATNIDYIHECPRLYLNRASSGEWITAITFFSKFRSHAPYSLRNFSLLLVSF